EKLLQKGFDLAKVHGKSKEVEKIISFIQQACLSNHPVLINGEEGSGVGFIAKLIHYNSERAHKSFVEHMLGYKDQTDMDIEIFGCEKTNLTGIPDREQGKLRKANKGTLFIEEISNLDLETQAKLLKLIREQRFIRKGSSREETADVRIIVSTKYNLLQKAEKGEFNIELYYALISLSIQLLSLRYHKEDVIPLAEYFAKEFCEEMKIPHKIFSKKARNKLLSYSYPGNISELKSIIYKAVISSSDNVIDPENIILTEIPQNVFSMDVEYTLQQYNELIIKHYLNKYNNNVVTVSKILNISKSTIYRLLKNEREISKEKN
ncbi:MAG: sigma 54-interacting transcriptional regulator, partial [Bacteroidales bacterium]|nr:sigma 54-interacting transcriptional regulator [Bacteroidales bacterium]